MTNYSPDSWVPLLLESDQGKIYKILAGWRGGFTQGDSWKLSSGIESISVQQRDGYRVLTMPQYSGSTYTVALALARQTRA
jgi:hypothetical protein